MDATAALQERIKTLESELREAREQWAWYAWAYEQEHPAKESWLGVAPAPKLVSHAAEILNSTYALR